MAATVQSFEDFSRDQSVGTTHTTSKDMNTFGLRVEGDAMNPLIPEGSVIICKPSVPFEEGKPVVANVRSQGLLVRIIERLSSNRIRLIPSRDDWPVRDFRISEFHWIYRVDEVKISF